MLELEPLSPIPLGAAPTATAEPVSAPVMPFDASSSYMVAAAYGPGYPPVQPYGYSYPQPLPSPPMMLPRYAAAPIYYPYPVYQAAMPQGPQSPADWVDSPSALNFDGAPPAEEAPLSRLAAGAAPRAATPVPSFTGKARSGFDRLSLTSWGFVRQERPQFIDLRSPTPAVPTGEAPLAPGGTLGGSQAGARLTWRFNPAFAANLRVSAPLRQGQRKFAGEAAVGLSWQPLQSVPVRLMAERRKAVGAAGGGRDAFALLAEGGVYEKALPWEFRLDGYAQTGVVGARTRDWFVDGGATVTRPFLRRYAFGLGAWGGAQPGLSRLDVGPRMSMQIRPGIRAHVDYRYRLFGSAKPGSGFAATVATDF